MAHTPGPWEAVDDSIVDVNGSDYEIASMPLHDGKNPTTWQADMRLIAAAPELLAALKALVADVHDKDNLRDEGACSYSDQMKAAEAAIAKAEGAK